MSRMIFVSLPVQDLDKSVAFFTELGFAFNATFSDENASCMVISDQACVMLLVKPFFSTFTHKDVAESSVTETTLALSAASREEVDALTDRALALGGEVAGAPQDEGYMYGRSFYDLDGHHWEFMWMDPAAAQG